jgi:hypothetical protein
MISIFSIKFMRKDVKRVPWAHDVYLSTHTGVPT